MARPFNTSMHAHSLIDSCFARNAETGTECDRPSVDGVLCAEHASEFDGNEAANAAIRLVEALVATRDPETARWQGGWDAFQVRRPRSLHRSLLYAMVRFERNDAHAPRLALRSGSGGATARRR